jgi:hypothetical protein
MPESSVIPLIYTGGVKITSLYSTGAVVSEEEYCSSLGSAATF